MTSIIRHLLLCHLLVVAYAPAMAQAQAARGQQISERLSDQEPYDRITLDEENQGAVVKVEPIDFPNREVPNNPDPESKLRVKFYAQPDKTYEVAWKHIKKVELFERMLLDEAQRYIAEDKFDDAYDALQHLKLNFPKAAGLDAAIESYLFLSAGRLFKREHWTEALAVLEELQRLNPDYRQKPESPPLTQVYSLVIRKIIEGYLAVNDYRAARTLLQRLRTEQGERHLAIVEDWEGRFIAQAKEYETQAKSLAGSGKLREANRACRKMLEIWPELPGGKKLAGEVAAQYPIVIVGVTQPAKYFDTRRLDDWGAQRAGRLMETNLIEFLKPGGEGGQYAFRSGSLQTSEDRRSLTLQLDAQSTATQASKLTGYDLAAKLLAMARPGAPEYSPTWASLCSSVEVRDVMRVEINLRRPYVLPQALLEVPWPGMRRQFAPAPSEGAGASFISAVPSAQRTAPAEITERTFADQNAAISALQRGEIDIVDRILPGDVARLAADKQLVLTPYVLPTLHLLLPSPSRPLMQNQSLRRAVLYATDREGILNEELLSGEKIKGCRVISGPFSPGILDNDALAYAVDPQLQPRPRDARLAAALAGLAQREMKVAAEKAKTKPPEWEVVLGYPSSEAARVASAAIAAQLGVIGLPCKLQALPPGETRDLHNQCDLVYTEVIVGEPVIDARRLLASNGVARLPDPYINLALRRLDESTNWADARERLKEIHRQVYADVSVIPLWQLVEYYARRADFVGLEGSPVSLYDTINHWRVVPQTTTEAVSSR